MVMIIEKRLKKLDNHFGKIIRINRDGTIPKDNPFISNKNALSDIYSYGHRNMQGLSLQVLVRYLNMNMVQKEEMNLI